MSTGTDRSYAYWDLGKFVVSLDQGVFRALQNFVLLYAANNLGSLGLSRRTGMYLLKIVLKSKVRNVDRTRILSYPVFGHIGMRVHRGHKFFDFQNGTVTKLFGPEGRVDDAEKEIAASRAASAITAAPRFHEADEDLRWYSEEYIRGTHASELVSPDSSDYLQFYDDIEECLVELALSNNPIRVRVDEHVNRVSSYRFQGRWERAGCASSDVSDVEDYLERLRGWLEGRFGDMEVVLVATHGDFSLVNAIQTSKGLRFIDWEGIGPGVLYSDLYNLLFTERYYGRTSGNFDSEVRGLVQRFRDTITSRATRLGDAAQQDQIALRRIYYLERTRLLLERDVTPNLVSVVKKSIKVFDEFDRRSGAPAL